MSGMNSTAQARAATRAIGADLLPGITSRVVCPFCSGGRTQEASFYVTRTDDGGSLLYVCHRASCAKRGRLSLGGSLNPIDSILQIPVPAVWDGDLSPTLPDKWRSLYDQAVCGPRARSAADNGLYGSAEHPDGIVWFLRDHIGQRIGVQTRRDTGGRKIVRSYKETPHTLFNYFPGNGDSVWLVEDSLSAAAISAWGPRAVALLGTYLAHDVRDAVTSMMTKGFIVALDPGAEAAAALVKERLVCYTARPVHVLYMPKDFKNMTHKEQKHTITRGSL